MSEPASEHAATRPFANSHRGAHPIRRGRRRQACMRDHRLITNSAVWSSTRNALALALVAALATPAAAHQYWLAPARYDAASGEAVAVRAFAGTGFRGEWKPWSPERSVRFVARA